MAVIKYIKALDLVASDLVPTGNLTAAHVHKLIHDKYKEQAKIVHPDKCTPEMKSECEKKFTTSQQADEGLKNYDFSGFELYLQQFEQSKVAFARSPYFTNGLENIAKSILTTEYAAVGFNMLLNPGNYKQEVVKLDTYMSNAGRGLIQKLFPEQPELQSNLLEDNIAEFLDDKDLEQFYTQSRTAFIKAKAQDIACSHFSSCPNVEEGKLMGWVHYFHSEGWDHHS